MRVLKIIFLTFISLNIMAQGIGEADMTSTGSADRSNFNLSTSLMYGTSLVDNEAADYSADLSLILTPSYRVNDRVSLLGVAFVSQGLEDERQFGVPLSFTDVIYLIDQFGKNDFLRLTTRYRHFFPTGETRREDQTYRGSSHIRATLTASFSKIGLNWLTVSFRPSIMKDYHQFKTFNGRVNRDYMIQYGAVVGISFSDKLSSSTLFILNDSVSYRGSRTETYTIDTSLTYVLGKKTSTTFGWAQFFIPTITRTGENNIDPFEREDGQAYATLNYTF